MRCWYSGVLLLWLLIHGVTGQTARSKTKPKPKTKPGPTSQDGKPPADDKFATNCLEDAIKLCGADRPLGMSSFLCLESKHDEISAKCSAFLGSTTVGGCDDESRSICGDYTDITDVMSCLEKNKDKLSRSCTQNLNNTRTNPFVELQNKSKSVTRVITAISLLYLLIPFCMAGWAMFKLRQLRTLSAEFVSSGGAGAMRETSRARDQEGGFRSERAQCHILFSDLSYWTAERAGYYHRQPPKRLLCDVMGEFQPSTLTAVMGPSGSGKTTLLRLLGGQLKEGKVSGDRLVNGAKLAGVNYDLLLRNQAFVHQDDQLLENLDVWATLVYASILRMPPGKSLETQLARAAFLLEELGLSAVWDSTVGSLSGGQRRRLSIAVEMCGSPAAILLDEPTSGLDATASLRVVQTLQRLSRDEECTVVMTIHQPRSEIFGLFDSLLLLGVGGILVFSGPTAEAAKFLAACPKVSISMDTYDNPGDFIIDVLGLGEGEGEGGESGSDVAAAENSTDPDRAPQEPPTASEIEMVAFSPFSSATNADNSREGPPCPEVFDVAAQSKSKSRSRCPASNDGQLIEHLSRLFSDSKMYRDLKASINAAKREWPEPGNAPSDAVDSGAPTGGRSSSSSSVGDMAHRALNFLLTSRLGRAPRGYGPVSTTGPPSPRPHIPTAVSLELRLKPPTPFLTSLWVLFGRRLQAHAPTTRELAAFAAQMLFTTTIATAAFSYEVDVELEKPYQIVLILFTVSTYAFILQYLIIPEYLVERQVVLRERSGGILSFGPYVLSALLSETPRAALQSAVLVFIVYLIHPLNDAFINRLFCVVCLTVGVCAWQSMICLCSVVTDSISVAYSLCFLSLGCGGLFGGLMVRLSKIPTVFKWVYYTSVTAVTQRALVVNDFQCCYLSATCNSIAQSIAAAGPEGGEGGGPQGAMGGEEQLPLDNNESPEGGEEGGPPQEPMGGGLGVFFQDRSQQLVFQNRSIPLDTFCPPGLRMTGDGSDSGNLGRVYLQGLGLEHDNPFASLAFLFFASIALRFLACAVLIWREKFGYRLES